MTRERRVLMNNDGQLFTVGNNHQTEKADFLQSFKKEGDKHLYMVYHDIINHCAFIVDSLDVPDEGPKGTASFVPIIATYYSNKYIIQWLKEMGFWEEWLKGSTSVMYVFRNKNKYNI